MSTYDDPEKRYYYYQKSKTKYIIAETKNQYDVFGLPQYKTHEDAQEAIDSYSFKAKKEAERWSGKRFKVAFDIGDPEPQNFRIFDTLNDESSYFKSTKNMKYFDFELIACMLNSAYEDGKRDERREGLKNGNNQSYSEELIEKVKNAVDKPETHRALVGDSDVYYGLGITTSPLAFVISLEGPERPELPKSKYIVVNGVKIPVLAKFNYGKVRPLPMVVKIDQPEVLKKKKGKNET